MDLTHKVEELYKLTHLLENTAWDLYRNLENYKESIVRSVSPKPLTYEELNALLESDEYYESGICVWVQSLLYDFVTAAVLDWYNGEVLAVYGWSASADEDNCWYGRDYGKTWVAYRERPVFEDE